jgi:hypothetical protein
MHIVGYKNLNSGFGESRLSGKFFSGINIWIVRSFKRFFKMFQLVGAERRPVTTLFPALCRVFGADRFQLVTCV